MPKEQQPRAILIDIIPTELGKDEAIKRMDELESLVNTYGGIVVVKTVQKRGMPDYKTYIGRGKVQEILDIAGEEKANLVILNNIAKAAQIYNLSEIFRKGHVEIWDRIDLILNIFDRHAQSTEAKLQIELAKIRHMGPRIFGMGKELMRQEGAKGTRSGPGETNIEIMKRHLAAQEQRVREKIKHYELINKGHRDRRRRKNLKTAALVGYTNAGKSSLMRALTGKKVYVANELFATLDTRVGHIFSHKLHSEILISDTIGFISDLPPELIEAFKSTLAETIEADLLLHVIDTADPHMQAKIRVVEEILSQLKLAGKPTVYVFNKCDLVRFDIPEENKVLAPQGLLSAGEETAKLLGWHYEDEKKRKISVDKEALIQKYKKFSPVFLSAEKAENLEALKELIEEKLEEDK